MTMTEQPTHRPPTIAAITGKGDRSTRVAVVALVVALVVAGTLVWWQRWGPGHRSVAVVGDSITAFNADALESGLGFHYGVTASGVPGARIDERLGESQVLAAQQPDYAVINLGTNDVLQGWDLAASMAALDQVAATFSGSSCIAVTTVSENMVKPGEPALHDRAVAFNQQLRALAAQRGWRLVDWANVVAAYEQSGQPEGPVSADTIHPSGKGQDLLVSATSEVLGSC